MATTTRRKRSNLPYRLSDLPYHLQELIRKGKKAGLNVHVDYSEDACYDCDYCDVTISLGDQVLFFGFDNEAKAFLKGFEAAKQIYARGQKGGSV